MSDAKMTFTVTVTLPIEYGQDLDDVYTLLDECLKWAKDYGGAYIDVGIVGNDVPFDLINEKDERRTDSLWNPETTLQCLREYVRFLHLQ